MKTINHLALIIFLFISNFAILFAQNNQENRIQDIYKIEYNLRYKPDSTKRDNILEETFSLQVSKDSSYFSAINHELRDSAFNAIYVNASKSMPSSISLVEIPKTKFPIRVFTQRSTQKTIVHHRLIADNYEYPFEINKLTWEIKKDFKQVSGYKCQLATLNYAGRNYKAWFSPGIPINDGPYIFKGLPGLIFEIYDWENNYHFTLTSILKTNKIRYAGSLSFNQTIFKVTRTEFLKTKKKIEANPAAALDANTGGFSISMTESQKQDLANRAKNSFNNPIELTE